MENKLYTLQETIKLIEQEKLLVIAGADELLAQLPAGNWIAGSNPYLQSLSAKDRTADMLYIANFDDIAVKYKFEIYTEDNVHNITTDAYDNSIIFTIMPATSQVLNKFALNAPDYQNQFINPLLGWVSGTLFEDFGTKAPTCYCSNKQYTDKAVALHIQLPDDKVARLEIVNGFEEIPSSPIIKFPENGFFNTNCIVDGKEHNFYKYVKENNIEYPQLIANYSGAGVNVGMVINDQNESVFFAGPVFNDVEYKLTKKKTNDYKSLLTDSIENISEIKYSYSCLYNLFGFGLDKVDLGISGVFTYGEIAYQLLNVTFVYLVIDEVEESSQKK